MKSFHAVYRRLVLLLLVCLTIVPVPSATLAQEPVPPASPTTTSPAAVGVPLEEYDPAAADTNTAPTSEPTPSFVLIGPDGQPQPQSSPDFAAAPPVINAGVQGPVTLDVSSPDTVRASDMMTYTYSYTNTTSGQVTIIIQAVWDLFRVNEFRGQFCTVSPDPFPNCSVMPTGLMGPAVTRMPQCPENIADYRESSVCYSVATLTAGQRGRFSVRLQSRAELFPKTNEPITTLSGSGRLFVGSSNAPTSEDTSASLVVGPVLSIIKTARNPGTPIYPTFGTTDHPEDRAEFNFKLGNAVGDRDRVDGNIRADARPANMIVVKDFIPVGAKYVSSSGGPTPTVVDTSSERSVTWNFPGPLAPGATIEFRVVYRRDNVAFEPCHEVVNNVYFANSREYPMVGNQQAGVGGPSAAVPVFQPMAYEREGTTSTVVHGQSGHVRIEVKSYWDAPIPGAKLVYNVQSNAGYVPGSATASLNHSVAVQENVVTWTFTMPAGSKTDPQFATFELDVVAGYVERILPETGWYQIILPDTVPGKCIMPRNFDIDILARLVTAKDAANTVPPDQMEGDVYLVQRGSQFEYVISVENRGVEAATGVTVFDDIPSLNGANFTYVTGSSRVNGVAQEPIQTVSPTNGEQRQLRWTNLSVPAGGQVQIRYRLLIDGLDFIIYNNVALIASGQERLDYRRNFVRVKIRPRVSVTKQINGKQNDSVEPGEVVTFTLTLENRETEPYQASFFDCFREDFSYLSTVEQDMQPTPWDHDPRCQVWPMQTLAANSSKTIHVRARVPSACLTRDYRNEGQFYNTQEVLVSMIPAAEVFARVNCGLVDYSKRVDRDIASLNDTITYEIVLRNADGSPASNVVVEDLLPQGFRFVQMEQNGVVTTPPTIQPLETGRTKLTWTVPNIPANTEVFLRYQARTGEVVGDQANLVKVVTGGRCLDPCITVAGENGLYSLRNVTVRPLITLEPSMSPAECAQPGDKRTYKVSVVNTNFHAYQSTAITVELPLGLEYLGVLDETEEPIVETQEDGSTTVAWRDLVIPQRGGATFFQKDFLIELEVGNVFGNLSTLVQATSPDGSIPRKEGVVDPTIEVCITAPTISKDVSVPFVLAGDEFVYQITLANPETQVLNGTTVTDELPQGLTYVGVVDNAPAPTVNGRTLSWTANVPARDGNGLGVVTFKIRVRAPENAAIGTQYVNIATVTWPSGTQAGNTQDSATVRIAINMYLPMIRK